jgi:glucokinase
MTAPADLIGVIDLGGTKIYSAVLDAGDRTIGEDLCPTDAESGCEAVLTRMADSLKRAAAAAHRSLGDLSGTAIAAPGPVIAAEGRLLNPPNLPGWGDVALGTLLTERLGMLVIVENDARSAAVGEFLAGAGQRAEALIYITVSTGVGGGFVIEGKLQRGPDGSAGEIGHMVIQPGGPRCGCGNLGCLEALASGTAMAREGREALARGQAARLAQLCEEDGGEVTAELIARAAADGDSDAAGIVRRAGEFLGVGLGNLVNLLNPDVIVIGGGVAHIGAALLDPAERMMREIAFPAPGKRVQIRQAELEYAAVIGLAGLLRTR